MSKFEKWVRAYPGGFKELALELEVDPSAISHWCSRRSVPRLETAQKILKLSNLTLKDILDATRSIDEV